MSGHVRLAVLTSRHTGSHMLGALAAIRDHVTVGWLLGRDVTAGQQQADRYGFVTSQVGKSRDWDNVCKDNSVDALVVCSPDASVNMVRRALCSGKSVLCERPVSLQPSALVACYEEADTHNAHLHFGFPRRFDPVLSQVKSQLDAGLLGEVQHVNMGITHTQEAASERSSPDACALFKEAVSLEVDTICWLLGTSPRSVYATLPSQESVEHQSQDHPVDSGNVVLKFDDALAMIDINDQHQEQRDNRLEIHGSKGVLLLTSSPTDGSGVVSVRHGDAPWRTLTRPGRGARHMTAISGVLNQFISAVKGDVDMSEDDALSLNTICVTAACRHALHSKETVTMTTIDTELPEVKLKLPMWKERPAAWF